MPPARVDPAALAAGLDPATLRATFGRFPSGVVAVCALVDERPVGFAASTFVAVSLDPPLVAFCVQDTSTTWPRLAGCERIGLSVLGEAHEGAARALAARTGDRFAELDLAVSDRGAVFVSGASAWLECSVHQAVPAGDHSIVLLGLHGLGGYPEVDPLVFHGGSFRGLRSGDIG